MANEYHGRKRVGRPKIHKDAPEYSQGAQQITIRLDSDTREFCMLRGGAKYIRGLILKDKARALRAESRIVQAAPKVEDLANLVPDGAMTDNWQKLAEKMVDRVLDE